MTTLPVSFGFYHLTQVEGVKWRDKDFVVRNIVKGLKQEAFKGYSEVVLGGRTRRFDQSNIEELVQPLVTEAGRKLRREVQPEIQIVPIPNSEMAVGSKGKYRCVELAEMLAQGYGVGVTVVPALRWDSAKNKAHLVKEFRHYSIYEPHLKVVQQPTRRVVLFDDVMTSGSQMIAAARVLAELGVEVVRGVVIARATKEQMEKPVGWQSETLDLGICADDIEL